MKGVVGDTGRVNVDEGEEVTTGNGGDGSNLVVLILIPGLSAHPAQFHARCRPDLYARALSRSDGLLHALHEVLGVAHQHVRGFLIFLGTYACSFVLILIINQYVPIFKHALR